MKMGRQVAQSVKRRNLEGEGTWFETRAGHLVVGSDTTQPALSNGRCVGVDHTRQSDDLIYLKRIDIVG